MTRAHMDGSANQHLDDEDLLRREASEGREYHRLRDGDGRASFTTYLVTTGSQLLIRAWDRWTLTRKAVRRRGLTPSK